MPKYLIEASYTADGLKGLAKDKGTGRVKAVSRAAAGLGGSVESFYFAFGDRDAILVVDLPDNVTAAGFSLAAASTGLVAVKTTPLLTADEVDRALKVRAGYKPPGKA
jgi:uncharacterized protein with GYD domain